MTDEDIDNLSTFTTNSGKEVFLVPAFVRGECYGCIGDKDSANRGWCKISLCHREIPREDGTVLIPADPAAYEEYKAAYVAFKLDGKRDDLPTWDDWRAGHDR